MHCVIIWRKLCKFHVILLCYKHDGHPKVTIAGVGDSSCEVEREIERGKLSKNLKLQNLL